MSRLAQDGNGFASKTSDDMILRIQETTPRAGKSLFMQDILPNGGLGKEQSKKDCLYNCEKLQKD
jgi:hypothetical protein